MDNNFIDKVHDIVMSHIADEKFGVHELASLVGLSTSQTLKKIKSITGKSVNQYIREIRLKKAIDLIDKTDLTIAEVAYKVGFSSQSYFNKTFRRRYGMTPGEYKTRSIETIENKIDITQKPKRSKFQKILLFSILIIVMLIIGYAIIDKSLDQKINEQTPSIAILPFKNINNEIENQYLADGMWDDLINHLAAIKGLDVRSRQSLEIYRGSKKSMPKIGSELNADYILESSIQKVDNKLRIITQLIDAKNDKHEWSHEYDYELNNIYKIQCEMSKSISKELNVILTSKEKEIIEKRPTDNLAAYHLFLKGRLVNNSRKKEDLELNIKLNEQAIALDSSFALAYAELGNSYYLMRIYSDLDDVECTKKAKFYSEKALNIDPNNFRAYAVLAMVLWSKDWDKAKEYHEKAIALNPNDAAAHLQYGRYYLYSPYRNKNKSLYYLTIAQRLDPYSSVVGGNFLNVLLINNEIEKAEEYMNKMSFFYSKNYQIRRESQIKSHKNKDWTEAIRIYKAEIKKDPTNSYLFNQLGHAYDEILNDDINFIKYSKKAYKLDSTNSSNAFTYQSALIEGGKFNEAKKIFKSTNFKSVLSEKQQLISLFNYYYHQENYKKAQEILKDSLMADRHFHKVITYAQLGDRKSIDSILKKTIGDISYKVFIYAILKERDSMYSYMKKVYDDYGIRGLNSRREFDPYRKEERYKILLKNNYLPITHWNE